MKIIVSSQEELVEVARDLQQTAKSVCLDSTMHSIQQTALSIKLCAMRDSVEIVGGGDDA